MPNVRDYDSEKDWMEACIPAAIDEGMEQDQAVAACANIWQRKDKSSPPHIVQFSGEDDWTATVHHLGMTIVEEDQFKEFVGDTWNERSLEELSMLYAKWPQKPKAALEFDMLLTKAEKMADGRTRWQARANTGQWDLERERFDNSFWDDVVHNFSRVQEATTKGEDIGLPVPILDIAHYSFRLPAEKRSMAQAGYPIKLWQDGQALMAQGYFCDTPLGQAAAKAAASRPVAERRVSVGVWPDWGRVELDEDGRRTYKGGRNRAYLDHLAMTAHPADPGTVLEVKNMADQKQDALDVLGEDGADLVEELDAATTKAQPEGAIIKGDSEESEQELEQEQAEPAEKADVEPEPDAEPAPDQLTMGQLQTVIEQLFTAFGEQLNERLAPTEAAIQQVAEMKAQIDALSATETEKVKAAIDSGSGDWLREMVTRSVQRQKPVKDQSGPQEKADLNDSFYKTFPGLAPKD